MVMVHQSVRTFSTRFQEQLRRSNYVTPKNYLDFIYNYRNALSDNRTTFSGMAARLDGGLQKLIQVRPCLLVCIHTLTGSPNSSMITALTLDNTVVVDCLHPAAPSHHQPACCISTCQSCHLQCNSCSWWPHQFHESDVPVQAASEVDSMQKELTQAKVVVEAATQDCNSLLEVITTSTADVETKQAVAIAKEEELKVPHHALSDTQTYSNTACSDLLIRLPQNQHESACSACRAGCNSRASRIL